MVRTEAPAVWFVVKGRKRPTSVLSMCPALGCDLPVGVRELEYDQFPVERVFLSFDGGHYPKQLILPTSLSEGVGRQTLTLTSLI